MKKWIIFKPFNYLFQDVEILRNAKTMELNRVHIL
jgi:hypothetical protein